MTPSVLDLAFFYTPAAEAGAGGSSGMRALLQLALWETNDAFQRSEAALQIRSVCQLRVDYAESGQVSLDLDRLVRPDDGWIDELHELRNHHAADLVCLVTEFEEHNEYAGIATQLWDTTPAALAAGFTVCLRPFLVGNYTLPHEIGHLLGGNHDRENAARSGLDPWSFATRIHVDGHSYRTIMAYRPGLQFPYFSNPEVYFRGVATGAPDGPMAANNVRTFRRTAPLISTVREPTNRVGFTKETVEMSESAGSVRLGWQLTGTATSGSFHVRTVDGSASEGRDYEGVDREIELDSYAFEHGLELTVFNNLAADGPRHFAVLLEQPSAGLALGPQTAVLVTILDDEVEQASVLDTSFRPRPGADYLVTSLAAAGDGRLCVAGGFATFNGERHARLVRLLPDGTADPEFRADIKYRVHALAPLSDGRLAVGGDFNTVNGQMMQYVAVLLADGTSDPQFQFASGADQPIHALMATPDDNLLIGGSFTNVGRVPAMRVARLLPSGAIDPTFNTGEGPDGDVLALAIDQQMRVILGGSFSHVGNRPQPGITRLHPDGSPDESFQVYGSINGPVRAVAADSANRVIVAGAFTEFQEGFAGGLIRLTESGSVDGEFRPGEGADGPILAIHSAGDEGWWIAGGFTRFDGQLRRRVARLHPHGALDMSFDPGIGPDDWVYALAPRSDGGLAVGGLFTSVNGVPRGGVAALLTGRLHPPRFTSVARVGDGLEWEAHVLPRQSYAVESTTDLAEWRQEGMIQPAGSSAGPHWSGTTNRAGYIRLQRVLQ
jgi:uncharacterized delta-60 repeat protein